MSFAFGVRVATLAATIAAFGTHSAAGQAATIPLGARVRFTTGERTTPVIGVLSGRTTDSLRIERPGGLVEHLVVALSDLRSLDRSMKTSGHGLLGAVIGLGAGVLIGSIVAGRNDTVECRLPANDPLCLGQVFDEIGSDVGVMVGSVLGGTILGAIVGSSIHSDTWRPVALTAQHGSATRVAPLVSGRRLGVSIAF